MFLLKHCLNFTFKVFKNYCIMKKLSTLVFAAILILNSQLFSQTGLLVTDYDYLNYPEVTFEYFIFQNSINQNASITENDIIVLNNDINISDKKIECSANNQSGDNSAIISIDLAISSANFNFDSVLAIANYLQLNTPNTEFALSSFNTVNHLNFDFNQSYSDFSIELGKLKNSNRSIIDSVFYSLPIGTESIFKNATTNNNKHIILFTDKRNPINRDILNKLKSQGIKLYLVILDQFADQKVREYFNSNDDFYLFENINKANLKLVSLAIKELINGNKPCKLTYNADLTCDTNIRVNLSVPSIATNKDFNFTISHLLAPRLELTPSYYGFSSVLPGKTKLADIVISAVNSDINVDSTYFSDDKGGVFSFVSGKINSPQVIPQGSNWTIKIEYKPQDSAIVFTKLIIASDACLNKEILITGGFPNTPPKVKNIKIENPNQCDEKLIVGEDYNVTWSGLLPSDVIQLEYSVDDGVNWDTLASNVTGLEHIWKVPDIESDKCLVRGIQLWPNNIGRTLDLKHPEAVNTAFFNHTDGSRAVTSCDDNNVRVWNTNTGKVIHTFKGHKATVSYAIFSHDDTKIVSSSNDTSVILWDANDESAPLKVFETHNDVVRCANFSYDDKKIISVDKSGVCKIYDVATGNEDYSFKPDGGISLWFATYHPNGLFYLTGGNGGKVKVWSTADNSFVKEFKISGWVYQFALNKDGSRLLIVDLLSKEATVWDFNTGTKLFTLKHKTQPNLPLNSGTFNEIGGQEYILTSGDDNTAIMWNSVGDSINVFREHTNSVRTAMFNFDGQRVITSSWDNTAKVWNLDERDLQMDTSDCVFTITKLKFDKNDLKFPDTFLSDYKDTILSQALINLNDFQFKIKNAYLRGANKEDFEIYTNLINSVVDTVTGNNYVSIDVRFKPTAFGLRKAELVLDIPGNEVVINLEGNCTKKDLEIVQDYITFEKVDIGDFRDKVIDIAVRNNSDRDLRIDSVYIDVPRANDYSIIVDKPITDIKKGEELGLIARFAPQFIDRSNADIVFVHNGNNSPSRISLLGTGSKPVFDTTIVRISNIEASSNNKVIANISLTKLKQELNNESFKGIAFDLSFNSTLLVPNFPYSADKIENGIRTVTVLLDADDSWFIENEPKQSKVQADETSVMQLEFSTALGNDSTTTLNINNSKVLGKAKLKINEEDGTFRLLDLCKEGGVRLFDASNQFSLETPNPNPITKNAIIKYELLENGYITLDLFDYMGNKVRNLVSNYKQIGQYSVMLDINQLAAGIYFLRLQSPNQSIAKKIQIER